LGKTLVFGIFMC